MSLLDDLKNVAHAIDPQFQVTSQEATGVLSAVVHYLEHGDKLLQAAEKGAEDVSNLISPPPADQPPAETPAEPATAEPPAPSSQELEAQISDLQAQLASRTATDQATVAVHEGAVV